MSLLIKDMEMPPCCYQCWNCDKNFTGKSGIKIVDWICLVKMRFVGEEGKGMRPEWCPLVDANEVINQCYDDGYADGYDRGYDDAVADVENTFSQFDRRRNTKRLQGKPASEPEIIRCKDCKYRPISKNGGFEQGFDLRFPDEDNNPCPCKCDDGWYSWMPADDWFCAEGKRKGEQE